MAKFRQYLLLLEILSWFYSCIFKHVIMHKTWLYCNTENERRCELSFFLLCHKFIIPKHERFTSHIRCKWLGCLYRVWCLFSMLRSGTHSSISQWFIKIGFAPSEVHQVRFQVWKSQTLLGGDHPDFVANKKVQYWINFRMMISLNYILLQIAGGLTTFVLFLFPRKLGEMMKKSTCSKMGGSIISATHLLVFFISSPSSNGGLPKTVWQHNEPPTIRTEYSLYSQWFCKPPAEARRNIFFKETCETKGARIVIIFELSKYLVVILLGMLSTWSMALQWVLPPPMQRQDKRRLAGNAAMSGTVALRAARGLGHGLARQARSLVDTLTVSREVTN